MKKSSKISKSTKGKKSSQKIGLIEKISEFPKKPYVKKITKILFFLLIITITVFYTYRMRLLVDDELFNYGFAKNIIDGLVPFKDFNMIIPPLFAYITALVLKIFGQKLIVYHILTAIIIYVISYLSSKKIGKSALIIYLLLLIYPYTGYNMFSLFLLFILLEVTGNEKLKDSKLLTYLEPIIISMIILTKHALGLLVIPSLVYSKHKLKTFLIYVVSFLILVVYLLINNSLMQFIDYTILGMFDFSNHNGTSINFLTVLEFAIIGYLLYQTIKTKKREYFYVLMFQIVTFPIVNYIHFMISFIPVVYLLLIKYNDNRYVKWLSIVAVIAFFGAFNVIFYLGIEDMGLEYSSKNNFMEGRLTQHLNVRYINLVDDFSKQYSDHKVFVFSFLAYQIKLNLDYPLDKYDLINNGNMGYNGSSKYIKEIDKYCQENKCIFFVNQYELEAKGYQTNKDILKYVIDEYDKIYSTNIFNIYIN